MDSFTVTLESGDTFDVELVPSLTVQGASAWDDLTGTVNHIPLDTTPSAVPTTEGTLAWDAAEGAPSYAVPGGDSAINKEIWDYYTNLSGTTLVDGDVVSIIGVSGNRSAVGLTDSTSMDSALACIGMVTYGGAQNAKVRVTKIGTVHGLNTQGKTEGAPLYVDPANPGKLTGTKPTGQNIPISVGITQVASATVGVVDVAIVVDGFVMTRDTTATPTAGKVAVWGTNTGFDADAGAFLSQNVGTAPRRLAFTVPDDDIYSMTTLALWTCDNAAVDSLPTGYDSLAITGSSAGGEIAGAVNGRNIYFEPLASAISGAAFYVDSITIVGPCVLGSFPIYANRIELTGTGFTVSGTQPIYGNIINTAAADLTGLVHYGLVDGKLPTAKISDLAANRGPVLTGTEAQARTAIGMGATGSALSTAATVAAARTTLDEFVKIKVNTVTHTSNSTFASDAEITHTLEADTVYKVEGIVFFDAPVGGGGLKITFIPPSLALTGAAGNGWGTVSLPDGTTIPVTYNTIFTNGMGIYNSTTARTGRPVSFVFFIKTGVTGGAMPMQTAQFSSNSTASTVLPGTCVTYRKLTA